MRQWKTKDGVLLYPKDMTNRHLLSCIKYLESKADYEIANAIDSAYKYGEPDPYTAAAYFFESEIRQLENETPKEYLIDNVPIYRDLVREARRRKILPFDYLKQED